MLSLKMLMKVMILLIDKIRMERAMRRCRLHNRHPSCIFFMKIYKSVVIGRKEGGQLSI